MGRDRTRKDSVVFESLEGMSDRRFRSDCRSEGYQSLVQPHIALCSLDNWGEEVVSPQGLPDGDQPRYRDSWVSQDDLVACDILGHPLGAYFDVDCSENNDCDWADLMEERLAEAEEKSVLLVSDLTEK
jgi:hypothetical protein